MPEVDGYTIHHLIDSGGFSKVYEATQHGLDRRVAIKVLNSTFEDERQQALFEHECKVMGRLSTHPNIVTVFASVFSTDDRPCIVMELYDGTFRQDAKLDIPNVVDVGVKVADALQAIHDDGIIHRDIKPHNIFLSDRGTPAVGDFGISRIENERTVTGAAGFSINYSPPETFEQGGADAPGDIYSLGATLFQLATGHVPFPHTGVDADKLKATVAKIITAPPPTLDLADAPPSLDRLLRRCMAKSVEDRPATPRKVAQELRQIQQEIGFPTTSLKRSRAEPSSDPVTPARPKPPSERTATRVAQVVDDRTAPRTALEQPQSGGQSRKRLLLLGSVLALSVVAVAGLTISRSGGADDAVTTTTTPPTTRPAQDFTVLEPPTRLTVRSSETRSYILNWDVVDASLKYQITEVGESDTRIVDGPPFTWESESSSTSACFEVRTVNAAETRLSQATAGPECASG